MTLTAEQIRKRGEWLRYHLASLHYGRLPKVEYRALERAVAECRWIAAYRLITIAEESGYSTPFSGPPQQY